MRKVMFTVCSLLLLAWLAAFQKHRYLAFLQLPTFVFYKQCIQSKNANPGLTDLAVRSSVVFSKCKQ